MSIGISQIVVMAGVLAFALYVFAARTVLTDRIIYLVLILAGITLALNPELSTRVANLIGIGRGTDLLLYTFVLFSLFHYVNMASHMKTLEQRLTVLVRANAIDHAVLGGPLAVGELSSGSGAQVDDRPEAGKEEGGNR